MLLLFAIIDVDCPHETDEGENDDVKGHEEVDFDDQPEVKHPII